MTEPFTGWRLRLDRRVRLTDGGRTLIGGFPTGVMRLSKAGSAWLESAASGNPLPAGEGSQRLTRRLVDRGMAHPVPPPGSGPTPDQVAVVVPVHDDPAGLSVTLSSLDLEPTPTVLVVDDASAEPVSTLRHEQNRGPAAARETGWRSTDRAFVAFVDADVAVPEGWLERLLPHFADPTVAAVAPRVAPRPAAASRTPRLGAYESARSPLDMGPSPAPVRPGSAVPYVPTAALVVRRSALEQVGGFDESLRVGEDVDLVWRLDRAGWRIRYEPDVVATHPTRATVRAWLAQRFAYGTSAPLLAERHGATVAPLRGMSRWSATAWAAVVAGHPLLGAAVAAATTATVARRLGQVEHPGREAARLTGAGHLWAGRAVAETLRRTWWPATLGLALARPRARPALAALVLAEPLLDWRRASGLNPAHYLGLRLLDDAAYGAGVWFGCYRERSPRALLPSFAERG